MHGINLEMLITFTQLSPLYDLFILFMEKTVSLSLLVGLLLSVWLNLLFFLLFSRLNLTTRFLVKGNRFAMPLSRIALQSPAGAARGQVTLICYIMSCKVIIYALLSSKHFVLCYILVWKFFWQADDIQNEANELLRIRDYLFDELSKKTGQPVEKVSSFRQAP